MSNSNKIISIAVAATVALCIVVVGAASVLNKNDDSTLNQTTSSDSITSEQTSADGQTGEPVSTQDSTSDAYQSTLSTTAAPQPMSDEIVGKWMDSAGMSGFEFFADGKVSFTYVNLSSFNIPFDGTAKNGMYTIDGNFVTIKFSIYMATIEKKYEVSISNDVLSMRDTEENETSTYTRATESSATTTPGQMPTFNLTTDSITQSATSSAATTDTSAVQGTLEGTFIRSDSERTLTFNSNSTVYVEIKNKEYSGVFQVIGSKLTLVYIDDGDSISEEYEYTLNGNILTLVSSKGETSVYVKQ